MKRIIIVLASSALILAGGYFLIPHKELSRESYENFLRSHEYRLVLAEGEARGEGAAKPDRPDLEFMQEFLRTMDPQLKRPQPELLYDINIRTAMARDRKRTVLSGRTQSTSLSTGTVWEERGPSMVGGRTRALLFDPADPISKKVWAGGVSGGLWYNEDITSDTSPWIKVNDFWDNLGISCIADDPNNNQVMYAGTGESHLGSRGGGIWKTIDGGSSWTRLTSTNNFSQVRDIEVRNENGTSVIYAAIHPAFGDDNPTYIAGLFRSATGGSTWTQVLPNTDGSFTNLPTDIEIGKDNSIWVGSKPPFSGSPRGSIIYQSTTGLANSWAEDETFTSSNFTSIGQIELGVAPSNENIVYAIIEEGQTGTVGKIIKTINHGSTWTNVPLPIDEDVETIPSDDFTRGQAWYDLTIAVHPTNANEVLVGGIDLFKTTNGGTSWTQLSKWWSGVATTAPVVHADQHEILYRPGFPGEAIFGNDGGVYYGSNLNAGTSSAAIETRNRNYNVTQFYSAALHPLLTDYMLGGTQDNGTQKFTQTGFALTTVAQEGDGAMCFIDQEDPTLQIVSYVYNDISVSKDGGLTFNQLINDPNSGHFINVGAYDSHQKMLYTTRDESSIYRTRVSSASPIARLLIIPGLGSMVTAFRISHHNTTQSNLYVGTEAGRVFKIIDAEATEPVISEITGASFPAGSVSSIAFGASEDQILVTFFNYGVVSVWETRNGGATWQNKEGNLPNMPVRWAEYHPHNFDQVYLATQLGVWSTDNLALASPVWSSTNGGLANVRTDMLQMRKSDGIMMASTHGRGVFTALIPSQLEQVITFDALPAKTFGDGAFTITANSTSQLPVVFTSSDPAIASVSGNTITIKSGGTVTITANQEGNAYYKAADPVAQTFTISKASQSITFGALAEHGIDETSFELNASSSSELPVTFTSSNINIAVVTGDIVHIQGLGTVTITAKQIGNINYFEAQPISRELTIVSRIINLTGELDYGSVIIGEKDSRDLIITNTGTAPISVSEILVPDGYAAEAVVSGNSIVVTITFTPTEPREYTGIVEVISNATSGIDTASITGTGITITDAEKLISDLVTIHPNPAKDWLTITGHDFEDIKTVSLIDEKGNSFSEPVEATKTELKLRVSQLTDGVYIIAIPVNKTLQYKKFIKIRD